MNTNYTGRAHSSTGVSRGMESSFILTELHIRLLERAYVGWDNAETGAPAINPKRPYGNSYVAGDVAKILGIKLADDEEAEGFDEQALEDERDRLLALHRETETALQIVLCCKTFEPGVYVKTEKYNDRSWKRVA